MVVTDDQGRYVVPDLPQAKYKVWVRGYGLVDSPKLESEPGKIVNHRATAAKDEAEAAKGYPAIYWYSMLKIPDASQFGGKSDIPEKVTQFDWLNLMKNNGCVGCHQLGQLSTRTLPQGLGEFPSHTDAWMKRTQAGQAGELMINILAGQLGGCPVQVLRRLDAAGREGRAAQAQAGAAARRRAQHRGHDLGLGEPEAVSARPDRVGPAQSDGQCLRSGGRLA